AVFNDPYMLVVHDHGVSLDTFCYPESFCDASQSKACVGPAAVDCRACQPCNRNYLGEPGHYFNARHDLEKLPSGWIHVGTKHQIPPCARYTACCGDKYVWVTDQDMGALSHFTLVILRIAHQNLY